jgi:hypothetical protein
MKIITLIFAMSFTACVSVPKLKDFNKIETGMSRAQVEKILGEPKTTKGVNGRTILEYQAQDGDETKDRWVVLEDREVIFFGRPREYKEERAQGSDLRPIFNNSNTVNVSNSSSESKSAPAYPSEYGHGERKMFFYPNPEEKR